MLRPPHLFAFALALVAVGALPAQTFKTLAVGPKPESVTRGFDGDLFVTLMGERRVPGDGDGSIVRVSGETVTKFAKDFDDPKGLAFVGDLLVTADFTNVWTIDASGARRLLAGPEAFPHPPLFLNDVAPAPDGRGVLVTDMGAAAKMRGPDGLWPLGSDEARDLPALGRVYRVGLDGVVTVAIDAGAPMRVVNGIDPIAEGRLYVAEFFDGLLLEWNRGRWRRIGEDYRGIDGIAHDRAGRVFVSEVFSGRVWRVSPVTGARVLLATLASAADLHLDEAAGMLIVPNTAGGELVFVPTGG